MKNESEHHDTTCSGTPVPLAGSGVGRVIACSCGNVHVDVEYVTLRFAPEAFLELAAMLVQAQRQLLERFTPPSAVPEPTSVH